MIINAITLQRCLPETPSGTIALFAPHISATLAECGLDTTKRVADFIAQVGHESGGLKHLKELWGPSPAQIRYEGRKALGNSEPGDGFKFRGRGLIQVTGRFNYAVCGEALQLDLSSFPELLEEPEFACASAGWFWRKHKLHIFSDLEDFKGLTRKINGGLTGLEARLRIRERAIGVLSGATTCN